MSEMLTSDSLLANLAMLTNELTSLTLPSNTSLLPLDLNTTNYIVENIVAHYTADSTQTVSHSVTQYAYRVRIIG